MFEDFNAALKKQYELGSEDRRNAFYLKLVNAQDLDSTDAPRMMQNLGTNPTFTAARDLMALAIDHIVKPVKLGYGSS